MALRIEMFSDFVCPFCYIGFEVMRRLKPEFDLDLQWRGFQIHPDWPPEGISAEDALAGSSANRRATWNRIESMANEIGLSIKPPAVFTSSLIALEAAEFAGELNRGEAVEERIYRAYFQEGRNIGERTVVLDLCAEAGLDRNALEAALDSGRYVIKLKNNGLLANQRGVSGVPTFFIGEFQMVGAQSESAMRHLLKRATERGIGA